ncbi:MAG: DUF1207 domain-containing protein [Gammaproteobacteria bacterium]|nr:MAG: DUF1207 domain-containing protein [Gammaproteobacteria bacterium]
MPRKLLLYKVALLENIGIMLRIITVIITMFISLAFAEEVDYSDLKKVPDIDTGFYIPVEVKDESVPYIKNVFRKVYFPKGDIFQPVVAEVKEHQFYISFNRFDTNWNLGNTNGANVGFGEKFGIVKWQKFNNEWQVSIVGGLFAQFNLEAQSHDLINADYNIGVSLSRRIDNLAYRTRLYHQSTHLGDEYVLKDRNWLDRRNFNYEAVDCAVCKDWRPWKICGGGAYILRVWPEDYERFSFNIGGEYRANRNLDMFGVFGRYIAGVQVITNEQNDWNINTSVKGGVEFGEGGTGRRKMRFLLEFYDGYVPYGQFYDKKMRTIGMGIYLGF